jgi:hypothetical protein
VSFTGSEGEMKTIAQQQTIDALVERQLALIDQTEKLDRLVYKLFKRVHRIEEKRGIDPHEEAKAQRLERQEGNSFYSKSQKQ